MDTTRPERIKRLCGLSLFSFFFTQKPGPEKRDGLLPERAEATPFSALGATKRGQGPPSNRRLITARNRPPEPLPAGIWGYTIDNPSLIYT